MAPQRRSSGEPVTPREKHQRSISSFFFPSPAPPKQVLVIGSTAAISEPALGKSDREAPHEEIDDTAIASEKISLSSEDQKKKERKRLSGEYNNGDVSASKVFKRLKRKVVFDDSDEEEKIALACEKLERIEDSLHAETTSDHKLEKQEDSAALQRHAEPVKPAWLHNETIQPSASSEEEIHGADGPLVLSGEALERFGGRIANKFYFLGKGRLDASGKRPQSPRFNPRTLFLPAEFVKGLTGGQRQWWEFKAKHMDKVLLFKMGKFYEMFEMDAHVGARDLDLQYMKGEQPHCGFPEKNYFENVEKLARKGHRVLVVEQTETPEQLEERKRRTGTKDKVVRREICAVITKGTMLDSGMINDNAEPSFLVALTEETDESGGSVIGLCVADTTRALFMLGQVLDDSVRSKLKSILAELRPVELVQPLGVLTDATLKTLREQTRKPLVSQLIPSKEFWDAEQTIKEIGSIYEAQGMMPVVLRKVIKQRATLKTVLSGFGGCISYLRQALLDRQLLQLGRIELLPGSDLSLDFIPEATANTNVSSAHMVLDSAALENLELLENSSNGGISGTLFGLLDHCITPFGRRLLKQWIVRPLCDIDPIVQRQHAIQDMQDVAESAVSEFRKELSSIPDLERLLARLSANSGANGRLAQNVVLYEDAAKKQVKELVAALKGFQKLIKAISCFDKCSNHLKSTRLRFLVTVGEGFPDLKPLLQYFKDSFDWSEADASGRVSVDDSNLTASDPREKLDRYLKSQQKFFKNLEICYVTVGKDAYLIEIPDELHSKVPSDYELRSSRKGFRRYWTPEVKELLQELNCCQNEKEAALKGVIQNLTKRFCDDHEHWLFAIRVISELDALMSLSCIRLHMDGTTCVPKFVSSTLNSKPIFTAKSLRHPIMAVTTAASTPFVPNDIFLGGNNAEFMLLTGPNMGGKSTLLRQVCLAMILAQIGAEVPAEMLELSLTDRLFVRMGAKDQIMSGQSTFLVELTETAVMLRCATRNSFVALDELGRGTATSDGQAIAHAVLHHLANNVQCRGMFSSHYHKVASDFSNDPCVSLHHMACKVGVGPKDLEAVTFLYKLTPGACPKSYGVNVARLAGMPESLLRRAAIQSAKLEKEMESHCGKAMKNAGKEVIKAIVEMDDGVNVERVTSIWTKAREIAYDYFSI